jgi:hypothetical protein
MENKKFVTYVNQFENIDLSPETMPFVAGFNTTRQEKSFNEKKQIVTPKLAIGAI